MANRIAKIFIWSFVASVVLVIGGLYFLPRIVPEDKIRSEVETILSRSLGKKVKSGKIEFSIFPNVEVYLSDIQIGVGGNATKFENTRFNVAGMSLFFGNTFSGKYKTTINGTNIEGDLFIDNLDKISTGSSSNIKLSLKTPLKFHVSGIFILKNDGINLKDFVVKTENSNGKLDINLHGFPAQQNLDGKIEFSSIDLQEIRNIINLVKNEDGNKEKNEKLDITNNKKKKSPWRDDYIDFSFLKNKINIEVIFNDIVDKETKIGNLDFTIKGEKNNWHIAINESSLFKGNVTGKLILSQLGDAVSISNEIEFNDIDLGNSLRYYTPIKRIEGFGDLSIKFTTKGYTEQQFIKNLSGEIYTQVLNGTYLGMDLVELTNASNKNIEEIIKHSDKNTDVRAFEAELKITDGMVDIKKFEVDMPFGQKFTGEGVINLVDYTLDAKLIQAVKVGTVGVSLPINISGDINNPKYFINPISAVIENIDQLEILKTKPAKNIIKGLGQMKDGVLKGIGGIGEKILDKVIPNDIKEEKNNLGNDTINDAGNAEYNIEEKTSEEQKGEN